MEGTGEDSESRGASGTVRRSLRGRSRRRRRRVVVAVVVVIVGGGVAVVIVIAAVYVEVATWSRNAF